VGHTGWGVTLAVECTMSAAEDVLGRARDYADGRLSTLELYKWLSARRGAIQDQLEADLWGLCFEVDEERLTPRAAHLWLSERLRQLSGSPRQAFIIQAQNPRDVVFVDREGGLSERPGMEARYSVRQLALAGQS
jgi:hypothetical protein